MKFCIYRRHGAPDARIGVVANDGTTIIDVHRAEVALLATRTSSRRAHEIAEHLVPSDPARFLASGACVWEFAVAAVRALSGCADAVTPRGEPIEVDAAACLRVPVLPYLLAAAEPPADPPSATSVPTDHAVAAVIGRHATAVPVDDAWDVVAAFVDVARDPATLVTPDELGAGDADVFCGVALLISADSAAAPLWPGDVVYSGRVAGETYAGTAAASVSPASHACQSAA